MTLQEIFNKVWERAKEAIGIDNSLLNACSILQQIHDGTPPHDWGFYLREFAANNNLIVPA